jgi:hypothetical protein
VPTVEGEIDHHVRTSCRLRNEYLDDGDDRHYWEASSEYIQEWDQHQESPGIQACFRPNGHLGIVCQYLKVHERERQIGRRSRARSSQDRVMQKKGREGLE